MHTGVEAEAIKEWCIKKILCTKSIIDLFLNKAGKNHKKDADIVQLSHLPSLSTLCFVLRNIIGLKMAWTSFNPLSSPSS